MYARAAASLLASCLVMLASRGAEAQRRWGSDYFPNVTLTTQHGVKVRFYDDLIKGKIVAINLIYTTCKYACPLETARLAQVQRLVGDRMGRDVFFYSITIDPEHDTPAVLEEYAAKFNAGPGWLFLTGRREDIDLLSRKTGLYSPPNPSNPDGHTPHLLVGNEVTGQWLRNSGVDDPRFLATTISTWLDSWHTAKPSPSYAAAPRLDFAPGEYAFTKHCAACHTVGGGDRIGPDLAGVTSVREPAWLTRFITEPDVVRAEGDAIAQTLAASYKPAVMPRLGLAPGDVAQIIEYIGTRSTPLRQVPPAAAATPEDIAPLVDSYIHIQRALNADTLDGIPARAGDIAAEANARGRDAASIQAAAATLEASRDPAGIRVAFGRLSDALIAYATRNKARLDADVKVAYCPMAQSYWLQRGEVIQNPYYGQGMSDCGRFTGLHTSVR